MVDWLAAKFPTPSIDGDIHQPISCSRAASWSRRSSMLTALNLELPVVWDSSAAGRARVQGTVWVPVTVQGGAPALVGAAPSS